MQAHSEAGGEDFGIYIWGGDGIRSAADSFWGLLLFLVTEHHPLPLTIDSSC